MSLDSILDTLITEADSTLAQLNSLLTSQGSTTLTTNDENTPLPTLSNNLWTLIQDTDNGSGLYIGAYTLALTDACTHISNVTIVNHQNPTDSSAPARYLPCGADPQTGWLDLSSVGALDGKGVAALEIRSQAAFEVTLELSSMWESVIDFTQGNYDFSVYDELPGDEGIFQNGRWESSVNNYASQPASILSIQKTFAGNAGKLTEFTIMYHCDSSANGGYRGILINGNETLLSANAGSYTQTINLSPNISPTNITVKIHTALSTALNYVTKITLNGTGIKPSELP